MSALMLEITLIYIAIGIYLCQLLDVIFIFNSFLQRQSALTTNSNFIHTE